MEESIHDAVRSGNYFRVIRTLKRNPNCVNDLNAYFESPLHIIYEHINPNDEIREVVSRLPIIKRLIDYGADVNAKCANDKTPLFYAIKKHQINGVKLLLENGADPHVRDNFSCETVTYAVIIGYYYKRGDQIIKLLLQYKADPNLNDKNGYTALDYAILYNRFDYVQILLDSGARVKNIYRTLRKRIIKSILKLPEDQFHIFVGLLSKHSNQIIERGQFSILNFRNFYNVLPTNSYEEERISTLLNSLQSHGVIIDFSSPDYSNLHEAVLEGKLTWIKTLLEKEEMDVNVKNVWCDTPLHLMILMKDTNFFEEIGRLLLNAGANWRAPNIVDETPFYLAVNNKAATLVKLMLSRIARVDDSMLECDATKLPTLEILYTENDAALHELLVAICVDCESAVDRLINEDYNIDEMSKRYRQDITIALVKAIELNKYNTVKILLESGFRTNGYFSGNFNNLYINKEDKVAISCLLWEFKDRSTLNKLFNTVVQNAHNSNSDEDALLYLLLFYYIIDNQITKTVPDSAMMKASFKSRNILSTVFNECKTTLYQIQNFELDGVSVFDILTLRIDSFVELLNNEKLFDACMQKILALKKLEILKYCDVALYYRLKLAIEKSSVFKRANN